jgi:hypothetical protein
MDYLRDKTIKLNIAEIVVICQCLKIILKLTEEDLKFGTRKGIRSILLHLENYIKQHEKGE